MFPIIQKTVKGKDYFEVFKALTEKLGGKFLDDGAFAKVFAVSPKQVVKIGKIKGNESYLRFVLELSKEKKHNPYFPKIDRVEYYNDLAFAVFMEKLTPTGKNGEYGHNDKGQAESIECSVMYEAKNNAALWAAGRLLRRVKYSHWSFQFDIHPYNLMLRGKQPVIIDPLANFTY